MNSVCRAMNRAEVARAVDAVNRFDPENELIVLADEVIRLSAALRQILDLSQQTACTFEEQCWAATRIAHDALVPNK